MARILPKYVLKRLFMGRSNRESRPESGIWCPMSKCKPPRHGRDGAPSGIHADPSAMKPLRRVVLRETI